MAQAQKQTKITEKSMAQVKVRKAKITELVQDDRNLNKGTERGKELIQKSIGQFGAVRGVAVDKDNRIIAGNKTVENAIEQGVEEIIIVETTGKELVVTKRVDTSLDTKEGREMALADNATVKGYERNAPLQDHERREE